MTGRDPARPTTPANTTSRLPGILTASKAPRLLGALTYVVGTLDLLTGLLHSWRVHLHGLTEVLPGALSDAAAAATVVSGIFLIVLGHSLKRRKRRAWRAAVALLTLSVVLHVIKTEPASAVISLVGLALLVRHRAEFRALGDPSTRWRAVRAFVAPAGGVRRVRRGRAVAQPARRRRRLPRTGDLVQELGLGMVGLDGPLRVHPGPGRRHRGVAAAGARPDDATDAGLPRPAAARSPGPSLTDDDEARLRELVGPARRLAGLLQHPPRQVGRLVLVREVGGRLPRRLRGDARQW